MGFKLQRGGHLAVTLWIALKVGTVAPDMIGILQHIRFAVLALTLFLAQANCVWAQDDAAKLKVTVTPNTGYARVLFEWPGDAKASAVLDHDVIVVRFDQPASVDVAAIERRLEGVAALVRQDTDRRGLRIALKTPVRLNTSTSGRRFAVDIVSPQMKTTPPPVEDPEAGKPKGPLPVDVRVSELESLTRVTFDWPEKVKYDTTLKDGKLTIRFSKSGTADVSRLQKNPPAWINSAIAETGPKSLTVTLGVDHEMQLSDRVEGTRIILDLMEPKQDHAEQASKPMALAATQPVTVTADAGPVDAKLALPPNADGAPKALVKTDAQAVAENALPAAAAQPTQPIPQTHSTSPLPASLDATALKPSQDDLSSVFPDATPPQPLTPGVVAAEMKGASIVIKFPFGELPKAAIFRRGAAVWLVFETDQHIDVSALNAVRAAGAGILSAPQLLQAGVTGMRLRVTENTRVTAQVAKNAWVLVVGPDAAPDPSEITFLREVKAGTQSRLRALVRDVGVPVWVKDPDLGDRLAITTAGAPVRGLPNGRRLTEFDMLPSLQGFVVRAGVDDLQVASVDGAVTIERPGGLKLSKEPPLTDTFAQTPTGTSPAAVDLVAWKRASEDPSKAARMMLRAAADTPGGLSQQRVALARYYVANDLGAEALGVLRLMAESDQMAEQVPSFRTLRAIANLQMRRYDDVVKDLSLAVLTPDPHAALWRGLAFSGLGKHAEARANLMLAMKYFDTYPPVWQARSRLALANASLALGDPQEAEHAIGVKPEPLPRELAAQYQFVQGRLSEALGRDDAALASYDTAMSVGDPSTTVRAELSATLLKVRTKKITPEQATDSLERLRYRWRGDDIEIATLRALGRQYLAMDRPRDGLSVMDAAARAIPNTEASREIRLEMQKAFAELFLGGKAGAMPPVQALAMFYDFKDLTPPGLDGDEMIRKLSDRLVEVDLLAQASELLQHQVDNRLDGIARATVASRLALIYLMDRKPEKSLGAIRGTRQVRLPDTLIAERRLIEARALTDLKLTDEAIEVLADDGTALANRLRADIFWSAQRWSDAAKASEALVADKAGAPVALADGERGDVMRAAVAYVLANDRVSVDRIRTRFGAKMADSADARSFAVVVGKSDPASQDMRAMVRQVASADSLDAFVKDMKVRTAARGVAAVN